MPPVVLTVPPVVLTVPPVVLTMPRLALKMSRLTSFEQWKRVTDIEFINLTVRSEHEVNRSYCTLGARSQFSFVFDWNTKAF
jgi:hypothetical protein